MEDVKDQPESSTKKSPGRPWRKGQSGNPKGRTPNDCSFTIAAKEYIMANPEVRENIVKRVAQDAQNGKEWATKLYWSYMDGQPPRAAEDPGSEENPLRMEVTVKRL